MYNNPRCASTTVLAMLPLMFKRFCRCLLLVHVNGQASCQEDIQQLEDKHTNSNPTHNVNVALHQTPYLVKAALCVNAHHEAGLES